MAESKIYNEIDKYIKNIEISVKNEYGTYVVYGYYEYAHCKIKLNYNFFSKDFEKYLRAIARRIVDAISYEYFYTKTYKEIN